MTLSLKSNANVKKRRNRAAKGVCHPACSHQRRTGSGFSCPLAQHRVHEQNQVFVLCNRFLFYMNCILIFLIIGVVVFPRIKAVDSPVL